MKTGILLLALLSFNAFAQTFAPQVITSDCQSDPQNLHDKLNSGKIIVIGWAMPCSSCAAPLLDVHNAVLNFAISHPGKVEYWVADDFANTDCVTLRNWALSNGISNATFFSTSDLDMYDFGAYGMPKVVVVGCLDHKIYYDVNYTPTGQGVTDAINQILSDQDNGCLLGLDEAFASDDVIIYPNPSSEELTFNLSDETAKSYIRIELIGADGRVQGVKSNQQASSFTWDVSSLESGTYTIRFYTADHTFNRKFVKIAK